MIAENLKRIPWVVVGVQSQLFGIASTYVQEMVKLSEVTAIPNMPAAIRGIINLRGQVMPLIDLRSVLGMTSAKVEMEQLIVNLQHREEDHKAWLGKLEKAVAEKTHFTGELNAHKCAFGRWYDTFVTNDLILKGLLKRFDRPHRHVHSIGATVNTLIESGKFTEASAIIQSTRERELAEMVTLFSITRDAIRDSQREIAVIINSGESMMALAADTIETVERLDEKSFDEPPMQAASTDKGLIIAVARRTKDDNLIMLLEARHIQGQGKNSEVTQSKHHVSVAS